MILDPIRDPLAPAAFDWTYKGLAPAWEGLTAAEIGARGDQVFAGAVMLPTAILRQSVIAGNRAWMRNFLKLTGAWLAPHGKTTLAPELFRQQAEDGAWAITAATAHHVRLYRKFGVSRILMANQLVGAADIDWVIDEMARDPGFDFYCLVDSEEGVEHLADRVRRKDHARPLPVLIEVGHPGGRCGVRDVAEGLEVAWSVAALAPYVTLAGIETFEALAPLAPDAPAAAQNMLDLAVDLARLCAAEYLFPQPQILLSAGGSGFFDLAAKSLANPALAGRAQVVLRSGCYITHDDGAYARLFELLRRRMPEVEALGQGLTGALQVWAQVLSLPEPGQVICGLGRRDVGTETDMPRAVARARPGDRRPGPAPDGLVVSGMFDQHTVLTAPPGHDLKIGDLLGFGVSHPCTTFDKWRSLLVVDDDYVVRDVVRTYF